MPTLPIPTTDPLDDLGLNAAFTSLAEQLAAKAGEAIGSLAWIQAGDFTEPWFTGGHYSEGWNHISVLGDDKKRLLILSNYFARPRHWPNATVRRVDYQFGEHPYGWTPPPGQPYELQGSQLVGGVPVFGMDAEHFLAGQILALAQDVYDFEIPGLLWNGSPLPTLTARQLASIGVTFIQQSVVGEMMAFLANKANGLAVQPPDRVTARLLWAGIRSAEIVGADGVAAFVIGAWVDNCARWLQSGPAYQTTKQIGTDPQVTLPYFNPVHSYGYMIPAVYRTLQSFGSSIPQSTHNGLATWLPSAASSITSIVQSDGGVPWAIDKLGVYGYYTPANGDRYTPGYEVYTALRIADALSIPGALGKAGLIRIHLGTKVNDVYYKPWLCDSGFNVVVP